MQLDQGKANDVCLFVCVWFNLLPYKYPHFNITTLIYCFECTEYTIISHQQFITLHSQNEKTQIHKFDFDFFFKVSLDLIHGY